MQKRQLDSLSAGTLSPFDATTWTEFTTTSAHLEEEEFVTARAGRASGPRSGLNKLSLRVGQGRYPQFSQA
jgi:hypothetical protein